MEGKAMNGKTLLTAAEIIVKAGEQISALMDVLGKEFIEELKTCKGVVRAKKDVDNSEDDTEGWLCTSWIQDFGLYESRKQKPSRHVAVQVVLYDENEAQVPGWEPALYVMYGIGEEAFVLTDCRLSSVIKEKGRLVGERLWHWEASDEYDETWAFTLPLVKLNSEKDLIQQIVEPVKKLIDGEDPVGAFPTDSVAFRFVVEEGAHYASLCPKLDQYSNVVTPPNHIE